MRWAAKHCFWQFGLEPLKRILRSRGLLAPQGANLAQLLRVLLDDALLELDLKDFAALLEEKAPVLH
eukprot:10695342-Lingulodinium_polyedra.AAC.1